MTDWAESALRQVSLKSSQRCTEPHRWAVSHDVLEEMVTRYRGAFHGTSWGLSLWGFPVVEVEAPDDTILLEHVP